METECYGKNGRRRHRLRAVERELIEIPPEHPRLATGQLRVELAERLPELGPRSVEQRHRVAGDAPEQQRVRLLRAVEVEQRGQPDRVQIDGRDSRQARRRELVPVCDARDVDDTVCQCRPLRDVAPWRRLESPERDQLREKASALGERYRRRRRSGDRNRRRDGRAAWLGRGSRRWRRRGSRRWRRRGEDAIRGARDEPARTPRPL